MARLVFFFVSTWVEWVQPISDNRFPLLCESPRTTNPPIPNNPGEPSEAPQEQVILRAVFAEHGLEEDR